MKRSKKTQHGRAARGLFLLAGWSLVLALVYPERSIGQSRDAHQHHEHPPPVEVAEKELDADRMVIPDVVLLNQDGEEVRFYSDLVKDRVVAINTIFTTCTTICPPMGANFSRLGNLMGEKVGRDFILISISVDPVTDTPQRLKAWSEKFKAGPGWTLLTGPKSDVDRLLKALKVFTADKWDHAPILLVGNEAAGDWTRAYGLAPPGKLAEIISGMIESAASKSQKDKRK